MNFEAEPIIAALVNMLVGLLVSKGIIDSAHAQLVTMDINNILAALLTLALGSYSIYKTVDAYKHKVTINAQLKNSTVSVPVVDQINTTDPTPAPAPTSQTGLPVV